MVERFLKSGGIMSSVARKLGVSRGKIAGDLGIHLKKYNTEKKIKSKRHFE